MLENGDISGWVFGSSKRALRVSATLVGNVLTASLPGRANMEDFVDAFDIQSISVSLDEGASWAAQVDVQDPLPSEFSLATGDYAARWGFSDDLSEATFEVTGKGLGWVGIGLNLKPIMGDGDFVIGWIDASGQLVISDRTNSASRDATRPVSDVSLGGTDDLFATSGSVVNGTHTRFQFSRKAVTGDIHDNDIQNRTIFLAYAWGNLAADGSDISKHSPGSVGEVEVNFMENAVIVPPPVEVSASGVSLALVHAVLMLVSWALIAFPSVFIARHLKVLLPKWFYIHRAALSASFALTIAAFIIIFVDVGSYQPTAHAAVGITIMALTVTQVILGVVSNATWKAGVGPRLFPDKLHWFIGRALLLLVIAEFYLGLAHIGAGTTSYILLSAWVGATLIYGIAMELHVGSPSEQQSSINDDSDVAYHALPPSSGGDVKRTYEKPLSVVYGLVSASLIISIIVVISAAFSSA